MSAPNPLIPQGTFQAQAAKAASNVRLAVATIVAIHVVFFGGLLLQGCRRDPKLAENDAVTNSTTAATSLIFCTVQTNDATANACRVTDKGAGTFTIRLNANATAETSVAFWVTN